MKSALQRLTDWYSRQCNEDWEHSYGFQIGTLDNPGVTLSVDLRETELESVPFEEKKEDYDSKDRWMICRRSAEKFEGRGAPGRLEDMIEEFLRWADLHKSEPIQRATDNDGTAPPSCLITDVGQKMNDLVPRLEEGLAPHGFRRIKEGGRGSLCRVILKRQTLNMNRAIAVVDVDTFPDDPLSLLKQIKKEVAFRCGFFPFFYGIGTQLVLVASAPTPTKIGPERYVDRYDNQWSIIQSVFIVRPDTGLIATARTWGQHISGKYQDAIEAVFTGQKNRGQTAGTDNSGAAPRRV